VAHDSAEKWGAIPDNVGHDSTETEMRQPVWLPRLLLSEHLGADARAVKGIRSRADGRREARKIGAVTRPLRPGAGIWRSRAQETFLGDFPSFLTSRLHDTPLRRHSSAESFPYFRLHSDAR
jgi:hypothetical protein